MSKARAGRQRKPGNEWLPPHVQRYKWGYRYYNRSTGELIRLASKGAARSEVWAAYEALNQPNSAIFSDVIDAYLRSPQYAGLAAATQRDYRQWSKRIVAVFGEMHPDEITSPLVQMFMDARGADYPTAANHEKSLLSMVMNWGKARGFVTVANPCLPVRNCKVTPGGRYVEVDDYLGFYQFLLERGHVMHAVAMEIAYLCGSRQQDVLRLLRAKPARPTETDCYVCVEGLLVAQAKTGKRQIKTWSPRLRAAVALAEAQEFKTTSKYLLRGRNGQAFTRTGFNSTWQRRQIEAVTAGVISARFRFHDLKVAAVSDYDGDKQHFSGHVSSAQMARYNRTPDRVKPVDG